MNERLKNNHYTNNFVNTYFWRTHDKAEIDYIEEENNVINAYEFKYKPQKVKFASSFLETYPNVKTSVITTVDFEEFIGL